MEVSASISVIVMEILSILVNISIKVMVTIKIILVGAAIGVVGWNLSPIL